MSPLTRNVITILYFYGQQFTLARLAPIRYSMSMFKSICKMEEVTENLLFFPILSLTINIQ